VGSNLLLGEARGELRVGQGAAGCHGMHHLPDGCHLRVVIIRVAVKLAADLTRE
jgi:hypothetical protein